ncbi:MAG: ABC transporter permease [Verrucomicrobiae bacterium]|nr:ABC transporter permease [Verrucomicrobiae bacterium]
MRAFFILLRKELRSFFLSPLAFVLLALFVFLNGWLFSTLVEAMRSAVSSRSLIYNLFDSGWFWMGYFILFPLITMRLFAEEKKLGTLEGLFTAPVRTAEVVLAKYFATVILYVVLLLPVFGFFALFERVTGTGAAFHPGAFWGSALILLLIGLFNIAIGTFASAVTSNQLIAAMITFVGVMLHYFLGFLHQFLTTPGSIWTSTLTYFSSTEHMHTFSDGLIDTRPIVYYLSLSALLLAFTQHILDYRKWRA